MYKKENKILLGSFIGLTVLIVVLYTQRTEEGFGDVKENVYKPEMLSQLDAIILQSPKKRIELRYNGLLWRVNDRYNADDQLITVLFATLEKVKPKQSVPEKQRNLLREKITAEGIRVQLYKGEEKVKEFYVAGDEDKKKTYFQDAEHGPHIVSIPGYRVYVAGIFELDEPGWRNRRIFDFNWRNIKKITSAFLHDTIQSFEIKDGGMGFTVMEIPQTDTVKLNNYLNNLSLLAAEQFIAKGISTRYDSLINTTPQVQITVTDVAGQQYSLALYPTLPRDMLRLGKKEDGSMVLCKRSTTIPALRGRNYFRFNTASR